MPYLHLESKDIPLERRDQAVERLIRLHRLMAQSSGFVSAQIWAELDTPGQFIVTRFWEDAAAHISYRASAPAKTFAADRPPVPLWDNLSVEEWVSSHASPTLAQGGWLVRTLLATPPPSAGITYTLLTSSAETPHTVMALQRIPDRTSAPPRPTGTDSVVHLYQLVDETK